MLGMI
jgi:hypothetical protein